MFIFTDKLIRDRDIAGYSTAIRGIFCILTAGLAILWPGTFSASAAAAPAPVEYQLDLRLDPEAHRIEGVATLLFPSPTHVKALRLSAGADVRSISADGHAIAYSFHGNRLELPVDDQVTFKQLQIDYRASFDDPLPRETVGVEDPSYGVSATILADGVFLAQGVPWFPRLDGERSRHRVRITAPEGMLAVTAGHFDGSRTQNGTTVSEWTNSFPLDGLALSAGYFQVAQESLDGIQLLTFLTAENARLAPGYLAAMRRHLTFYRELLGPYPFTKFAVVENFLPTGYGLPSWTLLGNSVVRLPFILDTSLPHEIVHSWWGNAIEVDYTRGNWAEGLTTYLADYLLKERTQPSEALAYRRKILRDFTALVDKESDFPLRAFTGRTARYQQAVGYGKGAMVFHMLRRQIGDRAFWDALQQLALTGIGRTVSWYDLEQVFARSSGQDLHWFFHQWVDQPGAPELTLANVRLERSGPGWAVSGEVRQTGNNYRFGIPLQLTVDGGETRSINVVLSAGSAPFHFSTAGRPQQLVADPAVDFFRRLAAEEVPSTINDLLMPQKPLVVVATGQRPLLEAIRPLLKGLHWDTAEIIDEADLPTLPNHDNRDRLLLGWPLRPELRPALPEQLRGDGDSQPAWHLAGAQQPGDTLFAVITRRHGQHGTLALFLAQTPGNARDVATKIPHYGRYSLLLFSAGQNLIKVTWEPEQSPLKHVFPKEL